MTNFEQASLDRELRVRESYSQRGLNTPPHLHTNKIAERHRITPEAVIQRLKELKAK